VLGIDVESSAWATCMVAFSLWARAAAPAVNSPWP
jgi:hypothetical protein